MSISLALIGSLVTLLATSLGAIPALAAHRVREEIQDLLTGFSAGIMLAASSFSLIIPALKIAANGNDRLVPAIWVGAWVLVGGAFLHFCNRWVPHEHFLSGKEGGHSSVELKRIWLFVFAITLHNFSEGLAVGSGVGSQSFEIALPILAGIGLQDMPEGFVVAMALVTARYSKRQALGVAVLTGVVEAVAAMIGFYATAHVAVILPWALAFAGGAMLYVVSDEVIPESHHKEHAAYATTGLMVGFVLMMILDTALG